MNVWLVQRSEKLSKNNQLTVQVLLPITLTHKFQIIQEQWNETKVLFMLIQVYVIWKFLWIISVPNDICKISNGKNCSQMHYQPFPLIQKKRKCHVFSLNYVECNFYNLIPLVNYVYPETRFQLFTNLFCESQVGIKEGPYSTDVLPVVIEQICLKIQMHWKYSRKFTRSKPSPCKATTYDTCKFEWKAEKKMKKITANAANLDIMIRHSRRNDFRAKVIAWRVPPPQKL